MRRALSLVLALAALTAWAADDAVDAASPAPAATVQALTQPVFKGREGEHPVQVAISFLGEHVYDEFGLFSYQRLQVSQLAYGADLKQVHVTLQTQGVKDAAKVAERFDMQMVYSGKAWQITSVRQDWKCKRGGWTQRPCAKA